MRDSISIEFDMNFEGRHVRPVIVIGRNQPGTVCWSSKDPHRGVEAYSQLGSLIVAPTMGSLYPALHRLENKRLLAAEWIDTDGGPLCEGVQPDAHGSSAALSGDRGLAAPVEGDRLDSAVVNGGER